MTHGEYYMQGNTLLFGGDALLRLQITSPEYIKMVALELFRQGIINSDLVRETRKHLNTLHDSGLINWN